jgi:hypothetical protein
MRSLALLLLVANLATLAISPPFPAGDSVRSEIDLARRELQPDKISVLQRAAALQEHVATPEAKPEQQTDVVAKSEPVPACVEWASISAQDVSRSRRILDSLGAKYRVLEREGPPELHWVYIPGIETAAAVDSLAVHLKAGGERNFLVSRQADNGTYSVSLGVFKSEDSARRMQERFQRLGALLKPFGVASTTYIVEDAGAIADSVAAAASEFDRTTVKLVDCPEIRAG